MGVAKRYYLVIRDKSTNDYNIINICDRHGNTNRANKLEVIDDLTMHYKDKEEFIDDLYEQGYVNNTNIDPFIVSPNSKNNYLDYFELVFNNKSKRSELLNGIIEAQLDKNIEKEEDNVKYILDRFAEGMYYNDEFNNIVNFGYSNVSKKFISYYKGKKGLKPNYQVKYKDGEWALLSYTLVRNIIDIMDRFNRYKLETNEMFEANLEYYEEVTPGRKKLKPYLLEDIENKYFNAYGEDRLKLKNDLLLKTDKNYVEGQMSFDEYLSELEFDDNRIKEQEDKETKVTVVMDVFRNLPKKAFSVEEDGTTVFNTNMFLYYEREEDKNKLSKLLDNDLLKDLDNYIVNLNRLKVYSSRIYDVDSLDKEVNHYETKIYNRLIDNLDELNDCYSWCLLYNKCMEDDIEYRKKLGEDNGKVYDKYGEYKNENN